MVTKIVIALLLFSQGQMIEHTITDGINDCLEKKRIMKKICLMVFKYRVPK